MTRNPARQRSAQDILPSLLGTLVYLLLRLWSGTWRRRLQGMEQLQALQRQGRRSLVLFWHGSYVPLFVLMKEQRACALTNRSWRGRIIAAIARRFGYGALQLPEEQGREFLRALRQALHEHTLWGLAADGPLGPYHQIKPRTVELAAHFGFTLLPVEVAANRCWRLKTRWDGMVLPLPFARVALAVGPPLQLPKRLDEAQAAQWAQQAADALADCGQRARRLLATPQE